MKTHCIVGADATLNLWSSVRFNRFNPAEPGKRYRLWVEDEAVVIYLEFCGPMGGAIAKPVHVRSFPIREMRDALALFYERSASLKEGGSTL